MPEPLIVSQAEAGQKLLQWLARRYDVPQGALHRWIRSGQVRINGKRAKAFDRLTINDEVRIPPFAEAERAASGKAQSPARPEGLPPLLAESEDLLVFNKPAGLPTHPGTGHTDSLASRLAARYPDAPFRPTPAHRLDKDTSGLLLVAKSYSALRRLADAFAAHKGLIVKEYLAWVQGLWPGDAPCLLEDRLIKKAEAAPKAGLASQGGQDRQNGQNGRERMHVLQPSGPAAQEGAEEAGKIARLTVRCVARNKGASLMLVRLHTGRTHQIRAQLSAAGYPLIGDVKYGGPACRSGLKLHAARLRLAGLAGLDGLFGRDGLAGPFGRDELSGPDGLDILAGLDSQVYEALPPKDGPAAWAGDWAVEALPPPLEP